MIVFVTTCGSGRSPPTKWRSFFSLPTSGCLQETTNRHLLAKSSEKEALSSSCNDKCSWHIALEPQIKMGGNDCVNTQPQAHRQSPPSLPHSPMTIDQIKKMEIGKTLKKSNAFILLFFHLIVFWGSQKCFKINQKMIMKKREKN